MGGGARTVQQKRSVDCSAHLHTGTVHFGLCDKGEVNPWRVIKQRLSTTYCRHLSRTIGQESEMDIDDIFKVSRALQSSSRPLVDSPPLHSPLLRYSARLSQSLPSQEEEEEPSASTNHQRSTPSRTSRSNSTPTRTRPPLQAGRNHEQVQSRFETSARTTTTTTMQEPGKSLRRARTPTITPRKTKTAGSCASSAPTVPPLSLPRQPTDLPAGQTDNLTL